MFSNNIGVEHEFYESSTAGEAEETGVFLYKRTHRKFKRKTEN
jgi:hypothetical protein